MKIVFLIFAIFLMGCSNDLEKTRDTILRAAFRQNGCILGVYEMRRQFYKKTSKDIPKEIRNDMIIYCLSLKEK